MDIGMILLFNFLSIPFIAEAEALGKIRKKFPSIVEIIFLRQSRSKGWLWMYMIFVGIFSVLVLFPSAEGKEYAIDKGGITKIIAMQIIVWCGVAYRIYSKRNKEKQP